MIHIKSHIPDLITLKNMPVRLITVTL